MSDAAKTREQLWYGVPFKQALQDVAANAMVGYKYQEFIELLKVDDEVGD